ncbi:glycosyltransferase family 2 protein [Cohnella faecalis]|uniref:Glycosyltransferase n=1 Tax=Cohnella faecalis TaxID=2315694 RepID=A0A398CR91_9BACL|nr:glycosyltransferase [Cohnella faecalis]RIE03779.1 glycosyltransferase [Cohnella faecalis]
MKNRNGGSPVLAIVVPCYNEEPVLSMTVAQLAAVLDNLKLKELISEESFLLFVDDGSKDNTWSLIAQHQASSRHIAGLKLARNAGHQKALWAGLMKAKAFADCVVSIDADLQDDPSIIRDMVIHFHAGCDVVYGVREKRSTDTYFKRQTAESFYKLMVKMGANIVYNHADYRLMSRRALDNLEKYEESNLFIRGLVPMVGLRHATVYYNRAERAAGESKYPLKKMLSFAFDGITSLSVTPIRMVTVTGFIVFLLSIFFGLYALISKLSGHSVSGWASLILSIWFIGGIQLMSIGLIGEYIGKVYIETKRRPRYHIDAEAGLARTEREEASAEQTSIGLSPMMR